MLLVKIGQLGQTIKSVQANNFEIEDNILEKLRLLKGFNDKLQTVSQQSAQQTKSFQDSLAQSETNRTKILSEKASENNALADKLLGMES